MDNMDNFFDSVDIDEINKASKKKQRETLNKHGIVDVTLKKGESEILNIDKDISDDQSKQVMEPSEENYAEAFELESQEENKDSLKDYFDFLDENTKNEDTDLDMDDIDLDINFDEPKQSSYTNTNKEESNLVSTKNTQSTSIKNDDLVLKSTNKSNVSTAPKEIKNQQTEQKSDSNNNYFDMKSTNSIRIGSECIICGNFETDNDIILDGSAENVKCNNLLISKSAKVKKVNAKSVMIHGTIEDKISCKYAICTPDSVCCDIKTDELEVQQNAIIKGNIKCVNASISGHVEGNISATGKLEISNGAIIDGGIKAAVINIDSKISQNCIIKILPDNK